MNVVILVACCVAYICCVTDMVLAEKNKKCIRQLQALKEKYQIPDEELKLPRTFSIRKKGDKK